MLECPTFDYFRCDFDNKKGHGFKAFVHVRSMNDTKIGYGERTPNLVGCVMVIQLGSIFLQDTRKYRQEGMLLIELHLCCIQQRVIMTLLSHQSVPT